MIIGKKSNVVEKEIDGEFILIPIVNNIEQMDEMYVLNETGSDIWRMIKQKPIDLNEIAKQLSITYNESEEVLKVDILEFIKEINKFVEIFN
jgi:tRNA uridine 5-carbamoylmethylation protein Kti12